MGCFPKETNFWGTFSTLNSKNIKPYSTHIQRVQLRSPTKQQYKYK